LEAIWAIDVVDFPAFIIVDDKGNDFFDRFRPRGEATVMPGVMPGRLE